MVRSKRNIEIAASSDEAFSSRTALQRAIHDRPAIIEEAVIDAYSKGVLKRVDTIHPLAVQHIEKWADTEAYEFTRQKAVRLARAAQARLPKE